MSWPFRIERRTDGWPMQLFVVYENPIDAKPGYPYVVRRWEVAPGHPNWPREAMCGQTLEEVRALIPEGLALVSVVPAVEKDPCIKEVWL